MNLLLLIILLFYNFIFFGFKFTFDDIKTAFFLMIVAYITVSILFSLA